MQAARQSSGFTKHKKYIPVVAQKHKDTWSVCKALCPLGQASGVLASHESEMK